MNQLSTSFNSNGSELAIIGLAGRFPGAKNVDEFWKNLQNGVESISFFTEEELLASGIDLAVIKDPNFVKAQAVLEDVELFDASFFNFNPREAEITDPQHRLFLECAWEALENAGYDSETYNGSIGVYGGSSLSGYVYLNPNIRDLVDHHQLEIAGDKDFLTTRVSYKLNLEGPSYTVQTACSTSLVAVHLASMSLLNGECDLALAGGVSISSSRQFPYVGEPANGTTSRKAGYFYSEGGVDSPDGHCRAFDAKAQGTVSGEGVGIVVLKRLEDALIDGDSIHAIIKGSAINNDGSNKVSYTAPRIDSQAKAIATAQVVAEVAPETITYIEAHGTGTALGDPIEVAALTQAFRSETQKKGFCAIGSVKTNIGHLDTAAGIASLIKTVLSLKYKQIPPSLHFEKPNPQIDFTNSPFYVNTTLSEWKTNSNPRRAGVSSFGIGGTNAHVILEEALATEPSSLSRPWQLLLISGKTNTALEAATANLVDYLQQHPNLNLADIAHTLQVGRRAFEHRRMLVCQTLDDAVKALSTLEPQRVFTHHQEPCNRAIAFMFPGQGAQYVNMARELYLSEPTFTAQVDYCAEQLKPHLGLDLRTVLYPSEDQAQAATQQLTQTAITQPALFAIEYALAKLWIAWGVLPEAMVGHSIGEYVAACLAEVFSLEDALALVAHRGRLMQQLPSGAMLSVQLPEQEVQPLLGEELSLAASNASAACVVSGATEAIERLQQKLQEQGVGCRRLYTSHAFHSQMMAPIIEPFTEALRNVKLNPPKIPFISNVSGTWITVAEATDPNYWARQLEAPVNFKEGIAELLKEPKRILLEVGPGRTLSTFAKQHQREGTSRNLPELLSATPCLQATTLENPALLHYPDERVVLTSLRHPQEHEWSDWAFLLNTLGRLWLAGVKVNWSGFYANERRHHIPLPTYPFERQRYWIEPQKQVLLKSQLTGSLKQNEAEPTPQDSLGKKHDIADWFYIPSWKRSMPPFKEVQSVEPGCWLVFVDRCGLGDKIVKQLELEGQDAIAISVGEQFSRESKSAHASSYNAGSPRNGMAQLYTINPRNRDQYGTLLEDLRALGKYPTKIVHLWGITSSTHPESISEFLEFYSLLFLAQAINANNLTDPIEIGIVSNNMHDATASEVLCPEKALALGPCKVIPLEYPNITCRCIDVVLPSKESQQQAQLIDQLLAELTTPTSAQVIAYRGHHRLVQDFEPVRLDETVKGKSRLRKEGVYLITGGLGGIGLAIADYLARTVQAKLILLGRSAFPPRCEWEKWRSTHDEQDSISRKIKELQALESLGSQVMVVNADITNLEQMQSAIARVNQRFGQIHGVIHAAATPGGGMIQLKTPEAAAKTLAPKVKGTRVLDTVFKDTELDFLVLFSSMNSFLGTPGLVDYCAANAFLDAFAHYKSLSKGTFTCSINWDRWKNLGMVVAGETRYKELTGEELTTGMTPEEGVEAFRLILCSSTVPQIVVSTQDFYSSNQSKNDVESLEAGLTQLSQSKPTHSRPNLGNAYLPPRNKVERTLAEIWQQLLGIEQVGIHDNFFELGGDSLMVTMLVSRVRKTFEIELPYESFFNAPTVAQLAEGIIQKLTKQTDLDVLAKALADIEQLSEDEVQILLTSQTQLIEVGGADE